MIKPNQIRETEHKIADAEIEILRAAKYAAINKREESRKENMERIATAKKLAEDRLPMTLLEIESLIVESIKLNRTQCEYRIGETLTSLYQVILLVQILNLEGYMVRLDDSYIKINW